MFERGNVPSVRNKHVLSGNLFEIIAPPNNLQVIDSYHQKLGKNFGMFYGPDPWVFSTDLELLYRLFVTEGNEHIDIVQFRLPFVDEVNNSLAQIQGDRWRRTRRILNPSFAHRQMKSDNVFEDINRACVKLLDCVAGHPVEGGGSEPGVGQQPGRIVDVLYNFKKFSVEVIFQVAYGCETGVNMEPLAKDPLIEAIHDGSKNVRGPVVWASIMFDNSQRLLGLLTHFTPIGRYTKFIHSVLDESLRRRRQISNRVDKGNRKMIDTIIESGSSHKLEDSILKANLFFIFVAGFETSANTLAILFWLLAQNLPIQEKLRTAIASEGEEAKYLEWCIQETLRLYPAVPTAIGRILHQDLHHNGMTFFKGTTINASIYSIHHCKEYWGQDEAVFRPERFGELKLHPAQYFAFGLGPRYCIGTNLAMAEMRAIVPRLLLKYRVDLCSTSPTFIDATSPNMIHMIIEGQINLKFTEISSL